MMRTTIETWMPVLREIACTAGFRIDESRLPRVRADRVYGLCVQNHPCSPAVKDVLRNKGFCVHCYQRSYDDWWAFVIDRADKEGFVLDLTNNPKTQHEFVYGFCKSGHPVRVKAVCVVRGDGWCGKCKGKSYDRVYLLTSVIKDRGWAKIGVASTPLRVRNHELSGWTLFREWTDLTSEKALWIEKRVIQYLTFKDYLILGKEDVKYGGYTETFPYECLNEVEFLIDDLINSTIVESSAADMLRLITG